MRRSVLAAVVVSLAVAAGCGEARKTEESGVKSEEAAAPAFGRQQSLCIFRETCGDLPALEHNGDLYACDHFVDPAHHLGNIQKTPLVELLESPAQRAFGQAKADTLPGYCLDCEVRFMCNGGCPKDRILRAPDGEAGLNYLCAGYKRFFTYCRPFFEDLAALCRMRDEITAKTNNRGVIQNTGG